MNTGVLTFFWVSVLGFFKYIPRSGITGSKGRSISKFLRYFYTAFHSGCISLCLNQQFYPNEQSQQEHGPGLYKHAFTWGNQPLIFPHKISLSASPVSVTCRSRTQSWMIQPSHPGNVTPWPFLHAAWILPWMKHLILCIWGAEFSSIYPFLFSLQ